MAHTSGPWAKNGLNVEGLVDPDNSQTYVAPICVVDADWREDVRQANQSLIAAAPEMLVALKRLLSLMPSQVWNEMAVHATGGPDEVNQAGDLAVAAINKAEGRTE